MCHLVSFVMYISGAKFEEHCFNISRDILYSVFYYFSCKPHDVITFLICIIQKRQYGIISQSQFNKEIGHQFLRSTKSLPFLGISIVMPCLCEICDLPFENGN